MIGGIIVQVVDQEKFKYVEVLDTETLDRCWQRIELETQIQRGNKFQDYLSWMSGTGYLLRYFDKNEENIGPCVECENPKFEFIGDCCFYRYDIFGHIIELGP